MISSQKLAQQVWIGVKDFQVQNDLQGIWGEEEDGKAAPYTDIRSKKKTLPIVYALHMTKGEDREALLAIYGRQKITTGNVGRALVRELVARGRRVRAVSRRITASSEGADGVEVTPADASDPAAARRAAEGASVVYNCVKLPYPRWAREMPPIGASIADAAAEASARLVVVEDLLMYGPPDGPLTEV